MLSLWYKLIGFEPGGSMDLEELAENTLNSMENEEEAKDQDTTNNEGEETKDGLSEGGESEEKDQESEQEESEEETDSEEEDDESGDGEQEESENETKELSDDELIELAKRRGLDLAKKEEEKKQEETVELKKPRELDDDTWGDMNEVQRTIYSGLPYMNVRGKDSEGNEIALRIKTPEQLPDDFEFINKREEASFISDVTAQSKRAEDAYAKIAGGYEQNKQAQARQEESQRVVADVERLQKEGIIPKIKAQPNTEEFDKDPSVKLVNEVLNYWQGLVNAGENVSVYTATKLYRADHPGKFEDTTKSKADDERKKVASKVKGSGKGGNGEKSSGPKFPVGTSASDIADYYSDQLD